MYRISGYCVLFGLLCFLGSGQTKIMGMCELGQELAAIGARQISTWVCIAVHASKLNTSVIVGNQYKGHGIFTISEDYWCSPPGTGCQIDCSDLRDDAIVDDYVCAEKIYDKTQKMFGYGFHAWNPVYKTHCSGDTSGYLLNCDLRGNAKTTTKQPKLPSSEKSSEDSSINRAWYRISVPIKDTITIS